ncbi:hypothetical protein LNKW23_28100 [Paralimibaculum aggregatum]|uniref:Uncharacterized protein n=1 Tax=Paralimibaculum aggregatum TaxID=3036245 RepID=A0ABQ6LK12_9RHOB|nr:hypothetical protein [Limibaculum sp. NKW23]GMG83597.1 hypothetical protein LNKW23_28100 [Limibaculum sp. NKW23]
MPDERELAAQIALLKAAVASGNRQLQPALSALIAAQVAMKHAKPAETSKQTESSGDRARKAFEAWNKETEALIAARKRRRDTMQKAMDDAAKFAKEANAALRQIGEAGRQIGKLGMKLEAAKAKGDARKEAALAKAMEAQSKTMSTAMATAALKLGKAARLYDTVIAGLKSG